MTKVVEELYGKVELYNIEKRLVLVENDIKIINTNLIEYINRNPKSIYNLNPRKFEELIADLFAKEGYQVELTPEKNDGGKDIYASKKESITNSLYAIECKKYNEDNKIGRPIIQKLYGVVESEKLTGGIVVTTSFFTKPAIEFSNELKNRIFLNDFYDLMELIKKNNIK